MYFNAGLDDSTRLARPHPHARHLHARADTRKNAFSCSADYELDCQPYQVDGYTGLNAMAIEQSSKPFCYDERLVYHVPVLYSNPNFFTLRSSYDERAIAGLDEICHHNQIMHVQASFRVIDILLVLRPVQKALVRSLVSAKRLVICLVENVTTLEETRHIFYHLCSSKRLWSNPCALIPRYDNLIMHNVVVCAVFGLIVSEAKTEIMCLRAKRIAESTAIFSIEAAGQVYNQTNEFVCLGVNVNHNADLSIEVDRRIRNAWCSFRKYTLKLYDRPSAPLELKIRILRAEVLEAMMCGCVTWSPRACHHDTLRRAHHSFLTRCIGWRKDDRADHAIVYLDTLTKTGSESIEATLRRRRILFVGFVARMEDTRLPKSVMYGEMMGGTGFVGRQNN